MGEKKRKLFSVLSKLQEKLQETKVGLIKNDAVKVPIRATVLSSIILIPYFLIVPFVSSVLSGDNFIASTISTFILATVINILRSPAVVFIMFKSQK